MDAKMVIFDLDGTLIDTIRDLAAAVEHALSIGGYPGHTVDEYRNMVGHGIRNLVTRALPEGSPEDVIEESLKRFVEYYTAHIDVLSRPYPGIPELLEKLSSDGFSLAVASNKFQEGTETLIRRFFPEIPFVKILGNAPGLPLKPDPEVIRLAIAAACHSLNEAGSPPGRGRVHSRFAAAEYGRWPVATPASFKEWHAAAIARRMTSGSGLRGRPGAFPRILTKGMSGKKRRIKDSVPSWNLFEATARVKPSDTRVPRSSGIPGYGLDSTSICSV